MRDTIIIHCSATRAGQDFTAADIDRWHRQRGFRRPADTRTEAQREALVRLVEDLRLVFPSLQQVIGHRDTSPDLNGDGIISPNEYIKSCPCFDVKAEFIQ